MNRVRDLWYRLLAWSFRVRYEAYIRVELTGRLDGPVRRVVTHRDGVLVLTDYSLFSVSREWGSGYTYMRRVA